MKSIILKNKVLAVFAVSSLVFLIAGLLFLYFSIADLTSPLILNFDEVLGTDLFGEKQTLWFVWATGFFIVLVNLFLGYFLFYRERILSYLVFGMTALFALLHFVAVARIISLN